MKRFITVLSGLLVLPAFAEVAPVYYDEIVEYTDEMIDAVDEAQEPAEVETTAKKNVAQRTTINRSSSRAISAASTTNAKRSNTSSRAMATTSRGTTARTATARTAKTSSVARPTATAARASVVSRSSRNNTTARPVTARIGTGNKVVMGAIKTNSSDASGYAGYIDDTTVTFTPSANTARAASTRRAASARLSTVGSVVNTPTVVETTPVITEEDVTTTTSTLTAIAELTDYCKAQYAACMDNYCNVLDDNQGRCSCSKNLKNYKLTEDALEDATEKYQEAIQQIKYIGLTTEQIATLFSETDAEKEMTKQGDDKTRIRKSLDQIKERLLVDAQSGKASSSYQSNNNVSLDASGLFNFDTVADFNFAGFMSSYTTTDTASVSNQRGEQLYKTATARCKTAVLTSCTAQGIDANVITNSYDLEIDKQCIAYERKLNDANSQMKLNARNAATILQQARLVLAQNRNSYDVRGCVAAIDACMQDEYVCGTDYSLCLDPTGKYLSDGAVVKGGTPGVSGGTVANREELGETSTTVDGATTVTNNFTSWTTKGMYNLYSAWNYNTSGVNTAKAGDNSTMNAWGAGATENLSGYINSAMTTWASDYAATTATSDMAIYLLRKLGYIDNKDNNKVHGMCASVMKQCQDYTFKDNKYSVDNEVVRQYLASALTKIKLQQDTILSDYAEDCRSDVSSCLSTNGYDENNTTTTASRTAVNACRADIVTCMSVGGFTPKDNTTLTLSAMSDWVASMLKVCPTNYYLVDKVQSSTTGGVNTLSTVECKACPKATELQADGTTYPTEGDAEPKKLLLVSTGGQATTCTCPSGYQAETADSNGMPTACRPIGSY